VKRNSQKIQNFEDTIASWQRFLRMDHFMQSLAPDLAKRVSVITINGGRDRHLSRLIEGLRRGHHPNECIVIEMGGPVREDDGLVRRIPLPGSGLPLAAARNAGRREAAGDILVFLDVDCIPSPGLVSAFAGAASAHDGLLCCEVYYLPDGAVRDGWTDAALLELGSPHPARVFPKEGIKEAPHPGLFWSLAFGVRAATFDRIGGFDEMFSGYGGEDTDFAFRAAALGVPVLFIATGRAYHQRHDSFDPPLQHLEDIARNAMRFHRRHGFFPMRDWLDAFARMGLVTLSEAGRIDVLRRPHPGEIEAARVPAARPF
jgi:glycosyltransferase involved in cell wall biosynthesis